MQGTIQKCRTATGHGAALPDRIRRLLVISCGAGSRSGGCGGMQMHRATGREFVFDE
jgi:hypothetical protein